MSADRTVDVRVTRDFKASAERVFDAWFDQKSVGRWLFATPTGQMVKVEIEPRLGGRWRIVERRDGEDVEHTGTYVEIDRPRRLVFTLSVPKYSQSMEQIIVDIAPQGSGCELALTHERLNSEYEASARSGWAEVLNGLERTIGING